METIEQEESVGVVEKESQIAKPGLAALLAEIGDENEDRRKVSCERIFPHESAGFLESVSYAEFSVDWLQAKHGGGKYRLKLIDEQGRIRESRTAVILGDPKTLSKTQAIESIAPEGNSAFSRLLELFVQENAAANNRHVQLLEALTKTSQTPVVDAQRTMRETLKTFAMIQDVFGSPSSPVAETGEGGGIGSGTEKLLLKAMEMLDKPQQSKTNVLPENQGKETPVVTGTPENSTENCGPSAREVGLWLAKQGENAVVEATKAVFEKLTDEQKNRLAMSIMG